MEAAGEERKQHAVMMACRRGGPCQAQRPDAWSSNNNVWTDGGCSGWQG